MFSSPYEEKEIYSNLLYTKDRQEGIEVDERLCRMTGIGLYMQSSPIAMYAIADRKLHVREVYSLIYVTLWGDLS